MRFLWSEKLLVFCFLIAFIQILETKETTINLVINQKKKNNLIKQVDEYFQSFFSSLKLKSEKHIYSNVNDIKSTKFTSKFFDSKNLKKISEFSSILKLHQNKCKKDDFFIYINGDDSFIPNVFPHILLLKTFMFKNSKFIFGINFGNQLSGLLLKCQNFEHFIEYLDNSCLKKHDSIEKCLNKFKRNQQIIYSYRYELILSNKISGIQHELKNNLGFNSFTCDQKMISPCDQKELKLEEHFVFRDEKIITTNLGITLKFRDEILKEFDISIWFADGRFSCQFQCNSIKKSCHPSLFLFLNDCSFMKNPTKTTKKCKVCIGIDEILERQTIEQVGKCKRCLSHDEGTDQPFYHENDCRLRSTFGFDCTKHATGTVKICACV